MMRLYSGCGTRRMTSTTIVLAILDDTTEPIFSFLLFGIVSAIGCYAPFLLLATTFLGATVFGAVFLGTAFFTTVFEVVLGVVFVTSGTGAAAAAEGATPFCCSTVRMRARSLRSTRSFLTPSICPIDN